MEKDKTIKNSKTVASILANKTQTKVKRKKHHNNNIVANSAFRIEKNPVMSNV